MAKKPKSVYSRPTHRLRDSIIVTGILLVLALAIVGVASTVAVFTGVKLVGSSPPSSTGDPASAKVILQQSHTQAAAIILRAKTQANSDRAATLASAKSQAAAIIATAEKQARWIRNHPSRQIATPTATSSTTATPQPTKAPIVVYPTPTPTSSLPYAGHYPSSWDIVAYASNPVNGTISIENVKHRQFSGIASLVFTGKKGKAVGSNSGHFWDLPGQSTTVVYVGRPPLGWAHFKVVISHIT